MDGGRVLVASDHELVAGCWAVVVVVVEWWRWRVEVVYSWRCTATHGLLVLLLLLLVVLLLLLQDAEDSPCAGAAAAAC